MANEEQLSILKQGVEVWNKWRDEHFSIPDLLLDIDLSRADLRGTDLREADFVNANLSGANLREVNLGDAILLQANLRGADLKRADFSGAYLREADLSMADLRGVELNETNLIGAHLVDADLRQAKLTEANLSGADFSRTNISEAIVNYTIFADLDLSNAIGLDNVAHESPSIISTGTFALSKGKIPEVFLRGCGLSDWEIEQVKLYKPDLSNDQFIDIQNRIFDLRNRQAIQLSPLFISYSHADGSFVDKLEVHFNKKGVRFWRDIHDMKSGRMEKQIDRAIRQNPTVLLVLSHHSLSSDWVEHEVRSARQLEKDMERDVLCPVALDNSWKDSRWPKRLMEQIMEYNILDFSAWEDDSKFDSMFRKLIDGLELFYKG